MPDVELEAMTTVANALGELDEGQRSRVLRWAADRFKVQIATSRPREREHADASDSDGEREQPDADNDAGRAPEGRRGRDTFEHFAELYDACGPSTSPSRALVAAYWVQVIQGKTAWSSFDANKLLKDLGHGDTSINKAFTSNMEKKPALVLQLKKAGKSQQGRKTYKLTGEGIKAVKAMMRA